MKFVRSWRLVCSLLLPLTSTGVLGQGQPLWELRAGLGGLYAPVYRGATETQGYALPYPHPIYRGRVFSADETGLHGWLLRGERYNLDISVAGGLPVPGDSGARQGMAQLDPTAEIGPTLQIALWRDQAKDAALLFDLPLRSVFSAEFWAAQHQGWVFAPALLYEWNHDRADRWHITLTAGPQFADRSYHAYYYGVPPGSATPTRRAYTASAGYNGSRLSLAATRKFKNYWLGALLRYDSLHATTFEDSPLVQTRDYFIAALAITWTFARSDIEAPAY